MDFLVQLPTVATLIWLFILGLGIGSFLNVLIARMPYDKSVLWPGSRCGACHRPLSLTDNLPVIGYLRLRGKCRMCGTTFSSRYLWIELLTGVLFVGMFVLIVLRNWHEIPGLKNPMNGTGRLPTMQVWVYYFSLAFLFTVLLVASIIDYHYFIIPPTLTYLGTVVGIVVSTLFPWPFPSELSSVPVLLDANFGWTDFRLQGRIPTGLALWPFWGPPPSWAPAGSWQLGFLTGLIGAAVGQFIGRAVKWLFEIGFQQDALGLGDADLMMMMGSFLGWQITTLALPAGAFVALPFIILAMLFAGIVRLIRGKKEGDSGLMVQRPFGPGIAAGAVACWFLWPSIGEVSRIYFFTPFYVIFTVTFIGAGFVVFGLLLGPITGGRQPAAEASAK